MTLALTLLGTFNVTLDGQPVRFATARARALLAYLAVEADRPHRREALAALLWPHHPEAASRQNLSQELARLRRAIRDRDETRYLYITPTTVQFESASADADVRHFQNLLTACATHRHESIESCPTCLSRLHAASALYGGDFLGGFSLKDNEPFNEWSLYQREHLHRQALDALEILVRHALDTADYTEAQVYAERQVLLEPWYEEGHRHLMRALAAMGHRSAALARYETCRRVLAAELEVEPSTETRAVYEHIRDAVFGSSSQQPPTRVLPGPLTPFIGRTREIVEIGARLSEPGVRVLTLLGIGGMGKTRLAIEAARAHADAHPDGVYFVPLVPQSEPNPIASAIANTLALASQGDEVWAEVLRALRSRRALLILDGFENLLSLPHQTRDDEVENSARRAVVDLLEAAPGILVLLTSRVRSNIPGEHIYRVEGLDYAVGAKIVEAAAAPAVRLLVESARRSSPAFTLDETNMTAVLKICDLAQGMPLAIELAAVRLELLTASEVAAEIEQSIDFLTDDEADVLSWSRSLRGVLEWSWQLLNDHEQRALRRLSVFRDAFTRDAAATIAQVSQRDLTGLVDKSLLRWNWTRGVGGSYDMHDMVRQFAAEQLHRDTYDREAVEARHAAFYLEMLAGFETRIDSLEAAAAMQQARIEAVHIAQAWFWAAAHGDLDRLNRAAFSLWLFYFMTGRWVEAERAFGEAVECLRDAGHNQYSDAAAPGYVGLLSKLLALHAYTLHLVKQNKGALAVAQEAMALAPYESTEGAILSEMLHGIISIRTGAPLAARPRLERALAQSQQHRQDYPGELLWNVGWACEQGLTLVSLALGDLAEANSHIRRALEICQTHGIRHGEATCLYYLGETAYHARDYPSARAYLEQGQSFHLEVGDYHALGLVENKLGETLRMLGDYGGASELLKRALATLSEMGSMDELNALAFLSRLELYLGDTGSAQQWLSTLAEKMGPVRLPKIQRYALLTRALLSLRLGEPGPARAHAEQAHQLDLERGNRYDEAAALIVLGHAATAAARLPEARESYQQAVRLSEELVAPMPAAPTLAAEAYAGLANVASREGDTATALTHAEAILKILTTQRRVGLDEPFITYLACYRTLAAVHDPRAATILAEGHALLLEYADHIADPALHQSFFENVAEHRELQQLYAQYAESRQQ